MQALAGSLSKAVAALAIGLYACGFLIVSLYNSKYGFVGTNPFRPRILAAGAWFCFLLVIPVAVAVRYKTHTWPTLARTLIFFLAGSVALSNSISYVLFQISDSASMIGFPWWIRASKDIERAWVMPTLTRNPFNSMLLRETSSQEAGKLAVKTSAFVYLFLNNNGHGPVWVKSLRARLVLVSSEGELPSKPKLSDADDQNWSPPPFVDKNEVALQLTADGSQVAKELCVVYGKLTYRDKFQDERWSTFGYVIRSGGSQVERLKSHPEYNRNT